MKRLFPALMLVVALFAAPVSAEICCIPPLFQCSKYPPPPKKCFKATKTDCFGAKFMKCITHKDCHGICIGQCISKLGCHKECKECCDTCPKCDSCCESCDSCGSGCDSCGQ